MGTISKDEANRLLMGVGYFNGVDKLIKEYGIPTEKIVRLKAGLYRHILSKVLEAKQEVVKIQPSITRMEAACRDGMIPKPHLGREAFDADYRALCAALEPFDGWTVSLLETDVSLLATVHDPATAGRRVNGLRGSFADLWNARVPGRAPFDNYPELFDQVILRR